jgi:succinate-semialdehyde dehydrogenase/glutarate-semialdehyde dehydrogenase
VAIGYILPSIPLPLTSSAESRHMKLNDLTLFRRACLIAGRWIEAEGRSATTIRNPATGEALGAVPDLGEAETVEAIEAAAAAQKTLGKEDCRGARRHSQGMASPHRRKP